MSAHPSPCDRLIARRRRHRLIAWGLFLAFVAGVVAFRLLTR